VPVEHIQLPGLVDQQVVAAYISVAEHKRAGEPADCLLERREPRELGLDIALPAEQEILSLLDATARRRASLCQPGQAAPEIGVEGEREPLARRQDILERWGFAVNAEQRLRPLVIERVGPDRR